MEQIGVWSKNELIDAAKLRNNGGKVVRLHGIVHKIREMSGFAFVILRTHRDLVQCVYLNESFLFKPCELQEGCAVLV